MQALCRCCIKLPTIIFLQIFQKLPLIGKCFIYPLVQKSIGNDDESQYTLLQMVVFFTKSEKLFFAGYLIHAFLHALDVLTNFNGFDMGLKNVDRVLIIQYAISTMLRMLIPVKRPRVPPILILVNEDNSIFIAIYVHKGKTYQMMTTCH